MGGSQSMKQSQSALAESGPTSKHRYLRSKAARFSVVNLLSVVNQWRSGTISSRIAGEPYAMGVRFPNRSYIAPPEVCGDSYRFRPASIPQDREGRVSHGRIVFSTVHEPNSPPGQGSSPFHRRTGLSPVPGLASLTASRVEPVRQSDQAMTGRSISSTSQESSSRRSTVNGFWRNSFAPASLRSATLSCSTIPEMQMILTASRLLSARTR